MERTRKAASSFCRCTAPSSCATSLHWPLSCLLHGCAFAQIESAETSSISWCWVDIERPQVHEALLDGSAHRVKPRTAASEMALCIPSLWLSASQIAEQSRERDTGNRTHLSSSW